MEHLDNAIGIALFLAALALTAWCLLHASDLIHAWIYEWKRVKNLGPSPKKAPGRADAPRLPDGHFCIDESGPFTQEDYLAALRRMTPTPELSPGKYDIRLFPTPDRFADPYLSQVRKQYTAITGEAEAAQYPRGS